MAPRPAHAVRLRRSYAYSPNAELAVAINSMHPSVEFRPLPDLPGNVYDGANARAALGGTRPERMVLLFRIGQWPSDYLIFLRSKTEVYARRFRNSGLGVCSIRRHIKELAHVLPLWARVLCSLWLLHSRSVNSSADLGPKFGGTDAKKGGGTGRASARDQPILILSGPRDCVRVGGSRTQMRPWCTTASAHGSPSRSPRSSWRRTWL